MKLKHRFIFVFINDAYLSSDFIYMRAKVIMWPKFNPVSLENSGLLDTAYSCLAQLVKLLELCFWLHL